MKLLAGLLLALVLAACEAEAPEVDALAPGLGSDPFADLVPADDAVPAPTARADAPAVAAGADSPRVRAILPDGQVVMLGDDDLMPGRFVARSSRYRIKAAVWAGE
jgi:hypothetical protein